jgi:hypothetical protein
MHRRSIVMLKSSKTESKVPAPARDTTLCVVTAGSGGVRSRHPVDPTLAAAWCAFSAHCEGREEDYRFWLQVFKGLLDRAKA